MISERDPSVCIKLFSIFFQFGTFIDCKTGKLNVAFFILRSLTNVLVLSSTIYCSSIENQGIIVKFQDLFVALMFVLMDALVAKDRGSLFSLLEFLLEPVTVNKVHPSHLKVYENNNKIISSVSKIAAAIYVIGALTWACIPLPHLVTLNIREIEESGKCFHLSFGWLPPYFMSVPIILLTAVISGFMCILNTSLIFAWSLQLLFTVLKLKMGLQIICIDMLLMDECKKSFMEQANVSAGAIPKCRSCLSKELTDSTDTKLNVKFLDQYEIVYVEPRECCHQALMEGLALSDLRKRLKEVINRHNRIIKMVELTNQSFNLQVMMFCQLAVPVGALLIANTESNLSTIEYINKGLHIVGVFDLSALYNYCGQILLDETERLRETLYSCNWLDKPQEIQRAVITMQIVANRPLRLTSGMMYNLSLESYTKVLTAVYSYTQVLQSLRT